MYIIFSLTTIQYIIDALMYPCNGIYGNLLLYFNHFVDVYIYFGSYFLYPHYNLLFILLTIIHWYTNDNKCILTEIVNKECYPKYKEYKPFNDFMNMSGINNYYPNISYYYLIFLIFYNLKNIYK